MEIPVKVKATGEIVYVAISVATAGNPLYTTSGGVTYLGDDIEPAEPDWQQVRIQAAIAAMNIVKGAYNVHNDMEHLVHHSVKLADALIAELQKEGGQHE